MSLNLAGLPTPLTGAATALSGMRAVEAEIHYSGYLHTGFTGGAGSSAASFPLDGKAQLRFVHTSALDFMGGAHVFLPPAHSRIGTSVGSFAGVVAENGDVYFSNLAKGINLSRLSFHHNCVTSHGAGRSCAGGTIGRFDASNGQFQEPGPGYIGFKFNTGRGPQYGWVLIKSGGAPRFHFMPVEYAWGDPYERVKTGQKQSSESLPGLAESGSLGLLAMGAGGVTLWRRRRATKTISEMS